MYVLVGGVISLRTANMWAHASRPFAWLRPFRTVALPFRVGMILLGMALGVLSLIAGALGHGVANIAIAALVARPSLARAGARFFRAHRSILWILLIGLSIVGWLLGGEELEAALSQMLNVLGGALLVVAIGAMMADVWGKDSPDSLPYIWLCITFDSMLLVSVLISGLLPLIVLEVYALLIDVIKLIHRTISHRPAR